VISIYFAVLIEAEMLRIERKPLTSSRQMLRHNAPKTAAWRRAIQTIAAEPDTSDLPVPQFEQEAP
jgi:hypothetical protein